MVGLLLADESDPAAADRVSQDPFRNRLDTPTATPISTPPPSGAPVARMIIEKLGIDAPVITMGVDANGVPQVPYNPSDVVWYNFSSKPGWGSNAVFAGHVDWTINGAPVTGVFYSIRTLEVGDIIEVKLEDGTDYKYKVFANESVPDKDPRALELMGATPSETITLITCGGVFYPEAGNPYGGNYDRRQFVRAAPVSERQSATPDGRTTRGSRSEDGEG
jgi:LPXTG-site transpeptidase (sortase) family protein